jgi:hypothetical protein
VSLTSQEYVSVSPSLSVALPNNVIGSFALYVSRGVFPIDTIGGLFVGAGAVAVIVIVSVLLSVVPSFTLKLIIYVPATSGVKLGLALV